MYRGLGRVTPCAAIPAREPQNEQPQPEDHGVTKRLASLDHSFRVDSQEPVADRSWRGDSLPSVVIRRGSVGQRTVRSGGGLQGVRRGVACYRRS